LGGFHQTLGDVGVVRREASNEQEIHEQTNVAGDGWSAHRESGREARCIQKGALVVGEHHPQSLQRLRRDARAELRNVSLEVVPDEASPQAEARVIAPGKVAVREAAAEPETVDLPGVSDLEEVERPELDILDAPGQAFPRLAEKVDGCGTENQEPARSLSLATTRVDESTQNLKEFWHSVDLVENHQLVLVHLEEQRWIRELVAVTSGLEVEVHRGPGLRELEGQRRLAHLPWADQGNDSLAVESGPNPAEGLPWNHCCILKVPLSKCNIADGLRLADGRRAGHAPVAAKTSRSPVRVARHREVRIAGTSITCRVPGNGGSSIASVSALTICASVTRPSRCAPTRQEGTREASA